MEFDREFTGRGGQGKGSAEDQHAPHMTWDRGLGKEGVDPAILPTGGAMSPVQSLWKGWVSFPWLSG